MHEFRVNFGNGQVHYEKSRAACERFISAYGDGWTFLQRRDAETGEWFKVPA